MESITKSNGNLNSDISNSRDYKLKNLQIIKLKPYCSEQFECECFLLSFDCYYQRLERTKDQFIISCIEDMLFGKLVKFLFRVLAGC